MPHIGLHHFCNEYNLWPVTIVNYSAPVGVRSIARGTLTNGITATVQHVSSGLVLYSQQLKAREGLGQLGQGCWWKIFLVWQVEINYTLPSLILYYLCFILNYNAYPSDVPSSNPAVSAVSCISKGLWRRHSSIWAILINLSPRTASGTKGFFLYSNSKVWLFQEIVTCSKSPRRRQRRQHSSNVATVIGWQRIDWRRWGETSRNDRTPAGYKTLWTPYLKNQWRNRISPNFWHRCIFGFI